MFDRRLQYVLLILLAALVFGGGYYYAAMKGNAVSEPIIVNGRDSSGDNLLTTAKIKVHIGGAVAFPGVYEMDEGDRVNDVLKMASPLLEADVDAMKLAEKIFDGESIIVPAVKETAAQSEGEISANTSSAGKINLNTASAAELETLPGIGGALAARIIAYRQEKGSFRSAEDLLNVSGIGTKKLEAIAGLISVN